MGRWDTFPNVVDGFALDSCRGFSTFTMNLWGPLNGGLNPNPYSPTTEAPNPQHPKPQNPETLHPTLNCRPEVTCICFLIEFDRLGFRVQSLRFRV